jgi:hypothetical protein
VTTTGGPDASRVAEIGRYRVLVEPSRSDLLALVEIAAQLAQVPMATINLITDSEQHQIATHGFDASVCAREDSMCNVAVDADAPVIVSDVRADERFRELERFQRAARRVRRAGQSRSAQPPHRRDDVAEHDG